MAERTAYAFPHLNPAAVVSYVNANPIVVAAVAALIFVATAIVIRAGRALRQLVAGRRPENVLTIVAAVIATAVQAEGMWVFFRDIVPIPVYLRVLMFAFIEVAIFVSGLRARRNIQETEEHTAGVDGIAVWVLAALSATLASTTAGSIRGALLRLTAPAVAAWLWERGLSGERRRARRKDHTRERRIHWRVTPERILVRLGLAEPTDRTATDVDAHRRLTRVARRAKVLRTYRAAEAAGWRQVRAQRRLEAAMEAAVEHAGLATDKTRQAALMAQLGAMFGAADLADLTPAAPWNPPPTAPALRLYRVTNPDMRRAQEELLKDCGAGDPFPATPVALLGRHRSGDVPEDQVPVPDADPHQVRAAGEFAAEVQRGDVPGIRDIKRRLRIGQDKARQVQAYLTALANQ